MSTIRFTEPVPYPSPELLSGIVYGKGEELYKMYLDITRQTDGVQPGPNFTVFSTTRK